MIRKFWLENAAGERKPLNNEQGIFLENPYGLGLETGETYAGTGDGFFLRQKDAADKQIPMGGDLIFFQRPYALYTDFMDWVLRSEALTLVYMPDTVAYRRRVALSAAAKTEKDTPRSLRVPVTFLPLTPWYIQKDETYTLGLTGGGFRVEDDDIDTSGSDEREDGDVNGSASGNSGGTDDRPWWDAGEDPLILDGGTGLEAETDERADDDDTTAESRVWDEDEDESSCEWARLTETDLISDGIPIDPKGQIPASFALSFSGAVTNPVILVVGSETGTEYGRCALQTSLQEGEVLEYSTARLDSYVRRITVSGTAVDLLDAADLQYVVFPLLPVTEACRVCLLSDAMLSGTLAISVQRYLRGV